VFALVLVLLFAAGVVSGIRATSGDDTTSGPGPGSAPTTALSAPSSSADASPSATNTAASEPTGSTTPDKPRAPRIEHVVVVSLDGFGSQLFESLDPAAVPTLTRLRSEGASTLDARTEVEQTVTLPNHTGMLTGRPIDPAVGGHGVTVNADRGGLTVQEMAGEPVSSVFTAVHDAGGSTALFATEDKFALFRRSWPEAIDDFATYQDQDALVMRDALTAAVDEGRTLTFVHLGAVDEVGHESGWLSARQRGAASLVDGLLGDMVDALSARPNLLKRTVLVVTADHGGVGPGHLDRRDPRNFRVPFLVWGAQVDGGADLYALNPQLGDPAEAQPGYSDSPGPVRNGFVANVVTQVLGLPPVDGSVFFDTGSLTLCADCSGP
jgi:hypothetical protein